MVVDLGGGTADLAVHGFMKKVDRAFRAWLDQELFLTVPWDRLHDRHTAAANELLDAWDLLKAQYQQSAATQLVLKVPGELLTYVDPRATCLVDGRITIPAAAMEMFFQVRSRHCF